MDMNLTNLIVPSGIILLGFLIALWGIIRRRNSTNTTVATLAIALGVIICLFGLLIFFTTQVSYTYTSSEEILNETMVTIT
jgi:hypothetical protein